MKIQFRYFRAGHGGFYESPGKMILSGRKVKPVEKSDPAAGESEVVYSPVRTWLALKMGSRPVRKEMNYLFTEEGYRLGQKEFLARLGWLQQQKLRWMYRDHWLQRPGNLKHTLILLLLFLMALVSIVYLEKSEIF
jgi:hypothetical protein